VSAGAGTRGRRLDAVVFDFGGVLISPITEKVERLAARGATTERLGLAPERVVYLDDFVWNVAGARAAGWSHGRSGGVGRPAGP
jgi:FMN phosphatase YigB (HAD superfamily)